MYNFCARRLGSVVAGDIVDAVCFGIYGVSSRTMTAEAFLGDLVMLESTLVSLPVLIVPPSLSQARQHIAWHAELGHLA